MDIIKSIPIADSNILISFFTKDGNFEKSAKILKKRVYINDYIICEVLNFLQNRFSYELSAHAENFIFHTPNTFRILPTHYNFYTKALNIRQKYADNLFSFTDAFILAQAEYHRLKISTRDRKLASYKEVEVV